MFQSYITVHSSAMHTSLDRSKYPLCKRRGTFFSEQTSLWAQSQQDLPPEGNQTFISAHKLHWTLCRTNCKLFLSPRLPLAVHQVVKPLWACCCNAPYEPRGVTTSLLADQWGCVCVSRKVLSLWGPDICSDGNRMGPLSSLAIFSRLGFRVVCWVVILWVLDKCKLWV